MAPGERVDIADCFSLFLQEETIDEADGWICPRCLQTRTALKTITLAKLPEVLIVQLKRFTFNMETFKSAKNSAFVDYPIDDFRVTAASSDSYTLCAAVNYIGGVNGGHCTATSKLDNRWIAFSDGYVTQISQDKIVTEENYLKSERLEEEHLLHSKLSITYQRSFQSP